MKDLDEEGEEEVINGQLHENENFEQDHTEAPNAGHQV